MFARWTEDPLGSLRRAREETRKSAPGEARLIRHGPKNGEELDDAQIERIRAEADSYFAAMLASPLGSIFTYHTSEFSRSLKTAEIFIMRLGELSGVHPEAQVRLITSAESAGADLDEEHRWLVVDVMQDIGLGFEKNHTPESAAPAHAAYDEIAKLFGGDGIEGEGMVAKLWISRKDELASFMDEARAKLHELYPDMSEDEMQRVLATLNPSRFGRTPEEHAIAYLETIRDTMTSLHAQHPDRAIYPTFVGHVPLLNFTTLALLGRKLTYANLVELGGITGYLESTSFKINDEGAVVFAEFRDRNFVTEVPLDVHIARLKAESDERRAEWMQFFK